MFVYGQDAVNAVSLLSAMGLGRKAIGRRTGVSVRTIGRWLERGPPGTRKPWLRPEQLSSPAEAPAYAYLLGLYLGDGYLAPPRKGVYQLRIYLDSRYPGIAREALSAISALLPRNRANIVKRPMHNLSTVVCSSKSWPILFPQHGPGRKHERKIRLESWQLDATRRCPGELIRGLIHSDGCRFVAKQAGPNRTYLYPRYSFRNRSGDIMRIFCDHLELLGIHWTMSSPDTAQIARRESVHRLDEFVGPKC